MKKLIGVLAILFLALQSGAQTITDNLQLGFTASPNIAWFSVDEGNGIPENDGVRTGFSYGVLADIGFARNYYFSTAFTLTTINGKTTEGIPSNSSTYYNDVYKIRYIEVPLTLKLKSNPVQSGRFYGQFGLGTGVKIGAKGTRAEKVIGEQAADQRNPNISDVKTFRLSMIIGGGAEWNINDNFNIVTGLTYNNGFTKVISGSPNMKNSYLALTVGVFF